MKLQSSEAAYQARLLPLEEHSYSKDSNQNMIIHGDNREALLLLQATHKGKIKCIYIDPPYNNGESYTHYNDEKQDHLSWLNGITQILNLLKPLLSEDGSLWISIDDNEMHYLKVAADSVFGREKFITTVIWQQRTTRENRSAFSRNHEYVLVYAQNPKQFKKNRNLLPITEEVLDRYKNPDKDPRGPWQSVSANVQSGHATKSQFYSIKAPNGKEHLPPNGRCWIYDKSRFEDEIKKNNVWFGKDGNGVPRIKKFLNGSNSGLTPETLWLGSEVGTNKSAKKDLLMMFPSQLIFDTPKPEQLIKRILHIATNEKDIVLDCYLGSGSTISTAHKMKRGYIGVEVGNHIIDYVVKRMKKVVDGETSGISKIENWQGGGGFTFYRLHKQKNPHLSPKKGVVLCNY